jgi:hypothetical protein
MTLSALDDKSRRPDDGTPAGIKWTRRPARIGKNLLGAAEL